MNTLAQMKAHTNTISSDDEDVLTFQKSDKVDIAEQRSRIQQ